MKKFTLTPEAKASLELQHHCCENGKERDRIKAVLLRSEGWTVPMISQALRINQSTIIRHIKEYELGKLKNESGGSSGALTESQMQELIAHLETHTYHHNHEIVLYVKEHFGIA